MKKILKMEEESDNEYKKKEPSRSRRVGKAPFFVIYNNVGIIIRDTEKKYSRYPLRGG